MNIPADRNLLFGLLALQNGMIDQSALVAAFHAWTRDKTRSIAEILLGQEAIDADDRALLEGLVAKHIKRHGDDLEKSMAVVPAPRSVVNSLAALADPEVDATLGHAGSTSHPTEHDAQTDSDATASFGSATSDGQRFRILRPHARGGLGAVFVALDAELNREVAFKQILDRHADDPTSRTRFVLEAEITGGLEHPGIVPVYGLGSDGGGRPYYAMRFVRGDTLKDAIAAFHDDPMMKDDPGRRSLALRTLLRRFVDVCNAVEYAHTRGVIHRDIKPANLLLDERGNLWITDFGLAQFQNDLGLTRTGEVVGTLRYMSPEQAMAKRGLVDHRTDIYSLGVTLYEMLTLEPVFDGADRHELLRHVAFDEPRPPRQVVRAIPVELETILLKAIAKLPGERYASAQELADDLRRFLDDKPVLARRPSLWIKLVKWSRRHRPTVIAAAVLLLMGVLGLGAATVLIAREHAKTKLAYRREHQKAQEAQEQRALAHESFLQARRAVDFFSLISEEDLAQKPGLQRMRRRLLEAALVYHRDFIKRHDGQDATNPSLQAELATSHYRVGRILRELGSNVDALAEFELAHQSMAELVRLQPNTRELRLGLATIANSLYSLQGCGPLVLLTRAEVQEELGVSEPQKSAIAALADRLTGQRAPLVQSLRSVPRPAQEAKFQELTAANERAVAEVLTPPQAERLQQITLQHQGPLVFGTPRVAEALQLTDTQKEKIGEVHEEIFVRLQEWIPLKGTAPPRRKADHKVRDAFQKKILALLTEEQKSKWRTMTGAPLPEALRLGPPFDVLDPYLLIALP
jgi:eukaryotic-like serine/threonine-protein kinase